MRPAIPGARSVDARGLLKPGDPTAAETLGKAFEGRIIDKLPSY